MRDLIVMTVPYCFRQLPKKELGNRLAKSLASAYVSVKVATCAELCHEAQVTRCFE